METTAPERPDFTAVQWLMDHAKGQGMVVSCYADTSVSGGVRSLWREHLDLEVRKAERALGDDPRARQELERNLDVVRRALSGRAAARARGMAVFASVARGLTRTFSVTEPFANRLVVDEELYILPLLEFLHRQRRYLLVHTDNHRARLYTAGRGPLQLIEEIIESVPRRQSAAGERWGKQQATIARHREDHLLHYRKELVQKIERAWREERYSGLVLFGEHVVLEHLRAALPASLEQQIVLEAPHPFKGKTARLETKVHALVDGAAREHDRRLIEDLRTHIEERSHVVAGPQEVIDAIRNSQVNWPGSVIMAPDPGATGWRCGGCEAIFVRAHETCPYCEARCQKVNLWQEIALLATRHGIVVHFVGKEAGLAEHGGVAAMLTRNEPWKPAPEPAAAR